MALKPDQIFLQWSYQNSKYIVDVVVVFVVDSLIRAAAADDCYAASLVRSVRVCVQLIVVVVHSETTD